VRELQAPSSLGPLLAGVRAELLASGREVPLLVKIAPDLSDEEIDAIAELALSAGLDGIVAVNTTVDRRALMSAGDAAALPEGGISGAPLKRRALEVLERLHRAVGDQLVLISVGGIETPQDVWERVVAGATLVQAYTGFVYGGPGWPRRLNRALAARVRDSGRSSIQELIGTGKPTGPVEAVR
jgi:dihydroorotate dehydrogenase